MLKTALIAGVIGLTGSAGVAHAGPKYDVKIEQAAKRIIAKKVGDIRGGLENMAGLPYVEAAPVEMAEAQMSDDLNPVKIAFTGPLASPTRPYRSGRPEPLRKVRTITSFIYY
jgi:hypothetical protein